MSARRVQLDLTCWLRARFAGVGLSALRSFLALRDEPSAGAVEAVARIKGTTTSFPITHLSPWARWRGERGTVYHGFETTFPRVIRSYRVLTVHDLWTLRENPYQNRAFQRRQSLKLAASIRRAHQLVTPSAHVAKELLEWDRALAERVTVVPWAPLLDDSGGVESPEVAQYVDRGRPYFLCVACLETRKNHRVLFEAMRAVEGIELVLVGGWGHGKEEVRARLEASGVAYRHFEAVPDVSLARLYQNAIALVQPSREEGFGMPVVEAMRFGKPLILSRIPVFEEVAGDSARYFALEDGAPALAEALREVTGDPQLRERLGLRAKSQSLEYSWAKTARKLAGVYAGGAPAASP